MTDPNFPLYVITFFFTLILTVITEKMLIPKLTARAKQPIYAEGPRWHMAKSGTPTMGGLAFLIAVVIALILSSAALFDLKLKREAISLMLCISYAALNALIGVIDDIKKLIKKNNAGLSPWQKLLLQAIIAIAFLASRAYFLSANTSLSFSFGEIELGWWYYPLSMIILLGITNCANLTDGIDGLASGVAFAIGVSLYYISCALCYEVCFISSAIIGASVGFLMFNLHPAKIFMGDTGSLFLGALCVSAAFALDNPFVIICVGGVYVLEGISVILQVLYYKLSGKRLFKMAPLHHHLEKSGWSENRICIVAIILSFILSIPAFIFYLP